MTVKKWIFLIETRKQGEYITAVFAQTLEGARAAARRRYSDCKHLELIRKQVTTI